MSSPTREHLFPSIGTTECRDYLAQARTTTNAVSEQIAERKVSVAAELWAIGVEAARAQARAATDGISMRTKGAFGRREWKPTPEATKLPVPRYMMATVAIHKLGDISSDDPDLCYVSEETDADYIGSWVTGFGFFNVHFPKETTRALTAYERERYNKTWVRIADDPPVRLNVG